MVSGEEGFSGVIIVLVDIITFTTNPSTEVINIGRGAIISTTKVSCKVILSVHLISVIL
jgi:hypothetical protein